MTIALLLAGAYVAVLLAAIAWRLIASAVRIAIDRFSRKTVPTTELATAPDVLVTLVHGTFARRADWTLPSSRLCRKISAAAHGPVRFEQFLWSGWNAVTSRRRAVERLTSQLAESLARWPHAHHFVIGHSHGGNIAFQAMRDAAVASGIAGVVCLSTPFLCAAPRNLGPVGPIAIWWFPVVVALLCLVPVVQLLPAEFASAAGGVAIILALGAGFFISPWIARFAGTVTESLRYPHVPPHKVLIVRSFGDEASAALGAAYMISWLADLIWSTTSRFFGAVLTTVDTWRSALIMRWRLLLPVCVVVGFASLSLATAESGSWLEVSGIVAIAGIAILLAILVRGGYVAALLGALLIGALATPSFLLIAALGIATGPELLIAALLCRVTAESAPPGGGWTVWQVPKDPLSTDAGALLMHSTTYDDEESLVIVSQWLAAREQQPERLK
jgi:hypothetical protein